MDVNQVDIPSQAHDVTSYPIANFLSFKQLSNAHKVLTTLLSQVFEPNTYQQAIQFSQWGDIMQTKLQALKDNGT